MGIFNGILVALLRVSAALIGAVGALWLAANYMVVEVEGSLMLPDLEPGRYLVASRTDCENLNPGDLVVYKSPYYSTDGRGQYLIRRISGIKNHLIEVTTGPLSGAETEIIEKDMILGKVIENG